MPLEGRQRRAYRADRSVGQLPQQGPARPGVVVAKLRFAAAGLVSLATLLQFCSHPSIRGAVAWMRQRATVTPT